MMTNIARGVVACASSLIVLVSVSAPSFAQTPPKSLMDQLIGHWRLVSISIGDAQPYGANPQGSMFVDAGGHYSVIVVTAGAASSISYFGTYAVDDADASMTMHIEASSRAGAAGRDEKRLVTFSGDELIVANERSARGLGAVKLTWKRAN